MQRLDTDDAALAARLLSRPRACLADLAIAEIRPQRILRLGDRSYDLGARFAGAAITERTAPRGWPDLVWCDHHFAGNDPAREVRALCAEIAPGTLVGAVEIHDVGSPSIRTWLAETLGTVADARVRAALDSALPRIHWSMLPVEGQWLALLYLGRVQARPACRRETGPLCEEMDAF
jgi:hypothetical protein